MKVKCNDAEEAFGITKGEDYEVVGEDHNMYIIINDLGEEDLYMMFRFAKVPEVQIKVAPLPMLNDFPEGIMDLSTLKKEITGWETHTLNTKPIDVSLLRDCWSAACTSGYRNYPSMDAMQADFDKWLKKHTVKA